MAKTKFMSLAEALTELPICTRTFRRMVAAQKFTGPARIGHRLQMLYRKTFEAELEKHFGGPATGAAVKKAYELEFE